MKSLMRRELKTEEEINKIIEKIIDRYVKK
jgi:hypothetical protein